MVIIIIFFFSAEKNRKLKVFYPPLVFIMVCSFLSLLFNYLSHQERQLLLFYKGHKNGGYILNSLKFPGVLLFHWQLYHFMSFRASCLCFLPRNKYIYLDTSCHSEMVIELSNLTPWGRICLSAWFWLISHAENLMEWICCQCENGKAKQCHLEQREQIPHLPIPCSSSPAPAPLVSSTSAFSPACAAANANRRPEWCHNS